MPITVTCENEFDPPIIRITIENVGSFDVTTALYENLREYYIPQLPPNPCNGE